MRPIRFRAWDPKSKVMFEANLLTLYQSGKAMFDPSGDSYREDWPLMQFTGLYDKNGKEIWEGDIVEFDFNADWCEGDYLPQRRFEVSLDIHRFWCKGEKFGYEGELLLEPSECEVLGNVWESPELLEKPQ